MAESTFFQEYFDKEFKRRTEEILGESTRESIIDVLEVRFEPSIVHALKPALDQIDDLQQLRSLDTRSYISSIVFRNRFSCK